MVIRIWLEIKIKFTEDDNMTQTGLGLYWINQTKLNIIIWLIRLKSPIDQKWVND